MSKENVTGFFAAWEAHGGLAERLTGDPSPQAVIACARELDFAFSEADLTSVMKELVYGAHSLPRGWGWPLARNLGLIRKS
jgi:hypothetical protein